MKKIIIVALAALVLISCTACASIGSETEVTATKAAQGAVITLYARTAKITGIDYAADTVTLVDGSGLVWQFFGCEDYDIGDLVSLLMSDAGTPETVLDDVIVSASYAGYFG